MSNTYSVPQDARRTVSLPDDRYVRRRKGLLGGAIFINLLLVIMEGIAFPMLWHEHPHFWRQAQFYTNQSNLLTLIGSALFVVIGLVSLIKKDGRIPHWLKVFRLVCNVQLYITFLVVLVGFLPYALANGGSLAAMYGGSMFVMHLAAPLLSLFSFLFLEGTPRLTWLDTLWGVLYTYIYTLYMVPLNALGIVEGPYPFLMVDTNPLWLSAVYAVTLLPGAYLVSLFGKLLNNGIACNLAGERREPKDFPKGGDAS